MFIQFYQSSLIIIVIILRIPDRNNPTFVQQKETVNDMTVIKSLCVSLSLSLSLSCNIGHV